MKLALAGRFTALLLIPALLSNNLAFAAQKPVDPAAIKAKVAAHGVGARVRVTLADDTAVKGLIVSVGEQSFAVKSRGVDQPREIQYAQVTGFHNTGLSTGVKIGIGVAIGMAAVVIGIAIAVHRTGY